MGLWETPYLHANSGRRRAEGGRRRGRAVRLPLLQSPCYRRLHLSPVALPPSVCWALRWFGCACCRRTASPNARAGSACRAGTAGAARPEQRAELQRELERQRPSARSPVDGDENHGQAGRAGRGSHRGRRSRRVQPGLQPRPARGRGRLRRDCRVEGQLLRADQPARGPRR